MLDVAIRKVQGAVTIDAAFSSAAAGVTALFGPSGSGKTSVVSMVAGLSRPDSGHVRLDGRPLFDSAAGVDLPTEKRRLGYVFQEGRLFPHMTVRANLTYGMRRVPVAERRIGFDTVVDLLGIGPLLDRRPARLSGGEKQRVAVGRALLTSPRLLLMDEPLAALDTNRKEEVLPFVARLPREVGIPILYVTHSMDEILRLADLLVLMDHGRSAAVGPVEDLLNRADLRPLTGLHEPGSVLPGVVTGHEPPFRLTRVRTPAGMLTVPQVDLAVGSSVRVRILARDVALADRRPEGISTQNIFHGRVTAVCPTQGPCVDVELDVGLPLSSRITGKAQAELAVAVGREMYALIKAVSIARANVGEHQAVAAASLSPSAP